MANEARCPKKAKMTSCIVAQPQDSITVSGCNHIHSLPDELLLEILLRLPNYKSVIQSKCVCKRWAALASHPRFSQCFIHIKTLYFNQEYESFAIVMMYDANDIFHKLWESQKFQGFFSPSIFHAQDSSFYPLHRLKDDSDSAAILVASCRDLLLYCRCENEKYDYFISNAQTRECVMLPSPPIYCRKKFHLVGFICDPYYYSSGDEIALNSAYHYSIVVMCYDSRSSTKICAHLFSSHCGSQWCDKILSLPEKCKLREPSPHQGISFCFDGKLHFSYLDGFFGFQHDSIGFDDQIQCHMVKWPTGMVQGNHRVGVSQGSLHLSLFECESFTISVWVLEDYKAGIWMLQHIVKLSDLVSCHAWITNKLKKFSLDQGRLCSQMLVRVFGFHPSRSNVIYLLVPGCIFLCDLSAKTVEFACRIPVGFSKKYKRYLVRNYGFPVIVPSWPTPLPPLVQGCMFGGNGISASCSGHQTQE